MKHLWIVLGQVPHCPAGWATAILECSYNEWVYLTFNSVWAGDSCQVESTSMPGPEFFFFFPGAHRIVTRRSMLISWPVSGFYVLADWVHACIKKAIHMQAHTHTHTHPQTHT